MMSQGSEEDILAVQDISYRYGKDEHTANVLQDISFSIPDGEFLSILGPSGCGKSTLLYLLGGFLRPATGQIRYRGSPIVGPSTERGIVFQDFALFDWRTAVRNVEFGLETKGLSKAERRATAMQHLGMVGLDAVADKYPRQLSGGMKQRVAIARALACNPAVLLMDEPFGALDALSRDILQDELRRIWRATKKTIVFVTHSIDEAVFLSQRILVLKRNPNAAPEMVKLESSSHATREECNSDPRLRETVLYLGNLIRASGD